LTVSNYNGHYYIVCKVVLKGLKRAVAFYAI
jgi:hypothetical protein